MKYDSLLKILLFNSTSQSQKKKESLGQFSDEVEAARAYDRRARELGKRTNFTSDATALAEAAAMFAADGADADGRDADADSNADNGGGSAGAGADDSLDDDPEAMELAALASARLARGRKANSGGKAGRGPGGGAGR